jgi:hypothetical protein
MAHDFAKITHHLRTHATPSPGIGRCAQYVREALEAGGFNTAARPQHAKDYGPFLTSLGFEPLTSVVYRPGDTIVVQAPPGHTSGHVAMLADDGSWYSDFKQRDAPGGPDFRDPNVRKDYYRHPDAGAAVA